MGKISKPKKPKSGYKKPKAIKKAKPRTVVLGS